MSITGLQIERGLIGLAVTVEWFAAVIHRSGLNGATARAMDLQRIANEIREVAEYMGAQKC